MKLLIVAILALFIGYSLGVTVAKHDPDHLIAAQDELIDNQRAMLDAERFRLWIYKTYIEELEATVTARCEGEPI